jgi:hypothetical protein
MNDDGWAFPALALGLSTIYCVSPFLFNPLSILHLECNVGLCLCVRHNSHLVPKELAQVTKS